jgi:predicted tellurium resistance membrane protein TerC
MLLVLICVELCDVMFAVDSIPAIVGITQDPFIVFTSNIFAIMGLRNLYVLLARAVQDLVYLKLSVSVILGLVGLKMMLEFAHVHVSSLQSLGAVFAILVTGVLASLRRQKLDAELAERNAALERRGVQKLLRI